MRFRCVSATRPTLEGTLLGGKLLFFLSKVLLISQFCPDRHGQGLTRRTGHPLVKNEVRKRISTFLGHYIGQGVPDPRTFENFILLVLFFVLLGLDRQSLLLIR